MQSICLDISIYYGASVHSSFSTTAVPFSDGQVEFDDETYLFQSVKPEHFLQVTLIALRNYTTGYGISPQSLGVLKIPVERLHESTISQWYPFCAANGITTLRSAIKLEITYSRIYLIFRNYDDCRESSVGSGAFDDIHCRAPTTQVSLEADAASSADKGFRRRSFTNFGRSQSQLGYARVPSNLDVFGKDGPGGDRYDRMPVGLADYFVIVGPTAASVGVDDLSQEGCVLSNNGDVSIWDRFPRNDYPDGPMPPKVEWFCFPDGAVYQWSTNRPSPQLSSYVMLAGDSRQYGVTLTYFVRAEMTHGAPPPAYPSEQATATPATNETWWEGEIDPMHPSQRHCFDGAHVCWMSVCICFLTRAPFVQQLSICLMKIYIADILPKLSEWEKGFLMDKKAQLKLFKYSAFFIESSFLLVSLCLDCPLPVPGSIFVIVLKYSRFLISSCRGFLCELEAS